MAPATIDEHVWADLQRGQPIPHPLMFKQPSPPSDQANPSSDQPADSPSPSDAPPDFTSDQAEPGPTSSPASSASSLGSSNTLRDVLRAGLVIVGDTAHQFLARDQAADICELYVVDQADAAAIGDPLASIASRHAGIGVDGNPDLTDALACMVGLALYAFKQLMRAATARKYRAFLAAGGRPQDPQGDQAQDKAPGVPVAADRAPGAPVDL